MFTRLVSTPSTSWAWLLPLPLHMLLNRWGVWGWGVTDLSEQPPQNMGHGFPNLFMFCFCFTSYMCCFFFFVFYVIIIIIIIRCSPKCWKAGRWSELLQGGSTRCCGPERRCIQWDWMEGSWVRLGTEINKTIETIFRCKIWLNCLVQLGWKPQNVATQV